MSKIIKVIRIGTPEDIRKSIKFIVDQLVAYNSATSTDARAVRLFSRFIPENYRRDDTIIISKRTKRGMKSKSVITIKPEYFVERCDVYSFKLKLK